MFFELSYWVSIRHPLLRSNVDAPKLSLVLRVSLVLHTIPSFFVHFECILLCWRLDSVLILLIHHFVVNIFVHFVVLGLKWLNWKHVVSLRDWQGVNRHIFSNKCCFTNFKWVVMLFLVWFLFCEAFILLHNKWLISTLIKVCRV